MSTSLTLDAARRISDATRAKGRELGLHPLTVAVLDAGGHVKLLEREDGSSLLRPQIAFGKAWGALGLGLPSRLLAERASRDPAFVGSLGPVSDGQLVPGAGGVLILGADGVIGAVGVSGDTPDNDETCAVAGIEGAGLTADTAAHPAPRPLDV
jgi:uncharacterized protein GlcG (DUF336 family)